MNRPQPTRPAAEAKLVPSMAEIPDPEGCHANAAELLAPLDNSGLRATELPHRVPMRRQPTEAKSYPEEPEHTWPCLPSWIHQVTLAWRWKTGWRFFLETPPPHTLAWKLGTRAPTHMDIELSGQAKGERFQLEQSEF